MKVKLPKQMAMEAKLQEFVHGKVLVVTVYNQVRANIDRNAAKIMVSVSPISYTSIFSSSD